MGPTFTGCRAIRHGHVATRNMGLPETLPFGDAELKPLGAGRRSHGSWREAVTTGAGAISPVLPAYAFEARGSEKDSRGARYRPSARAAPSSAVRSLCMTTCTGVARKRSAWDPLPTKREQKSDP